MTTLSVFNTVSLDGYFTGRGGDMQWAHEGSNDPEWQQFVSGNAGGGGALLLGRVTWEMMASWWPSEMAKQAMPAVADGMNRMTKYVASRTMKTAAWSNSIILGGDVVDEARRLRKAGGPDITILGSGSIVAQLAKAKLIDRYTVVVAPLAIGEGRSMFEQAGRVSMKLESSRSFRNGKVVLTYTSA